jgi:hypothetical protein
MTQSQHLDFGRTFLRSRRQPEGRSVDLKASTSRTQSACVLNPQEAKDGTTKVRSCSLQVVAIFFSSSRNLRFLPCCKHLLVKPIVRIKFALRGTQAKGVGEEHP